MCKKNFNEGILNWKNVLPKAIWLTPRRHNTILIIGSGFLNTIYTISKAKSKKFTVCFQENSSPKNTYIYVGFHCKKVRLKTIILLN